VQASNGDLYGTTQNGGAYGDLYGATHTNGAYGASTIFRITLAGDFTTLYAFCSVPGCPDGEYSAAALVQGADGNFYGVISTGGVGNGGGTFFTMTQAARRPRFTSSAPGGLTFAGQALYLASYARSSPASPQE
jgi:uncharacterized repeat protein (TIGR03803 family)